VIRFIYSNSFFFFFCCSSCPCHTSFASVIVTMMLNIGCYFFFVFSLEKKTDSIFWKMIIHDFDITGFFNSNKRFSPSSRLLEFQHELMIMRIWLQQSILVFEWICQTKFHVLMEFCHMQQFISPNELENRSRNLYLLKEHSQFLIFDISIRKVFADSSTFDNIFI